MFYFLKLGKWDEELDWKSNQIEFAFFLFKWAFNRIRDLGFLTSFVTYSFSNYNA